MAAVLARCCWRSLRRRTPSMTIATEAPSSLSPAAMMSRVSGPTAATTTNSLAASHRAASTTSSSGKSSFGMHYERRGNGPPVLCLPGALGTGKSDFGHQLSGMSKDFTVIAPDPLGYGQSRPPDRDWSVGFIQRDATDAQRLMEELGYDTYSVIGWSDGANSATILAANFPEQVNRLVVFGGNAFVDDDDLACYDRTADVSQWSPRMRESMGAIYGDHFPGMWAAWLRSMRELHAQGGKICDDELERIQCPVLILHGVLDPMVPEQHPKHIKNKLGKLGKLYLFPEGKHNVHIRYKGVFNEVVTSFLKNPKAPLPEIMQA
eukprot:m.483157 g.483157  ORF g.483157 m.483157 type:complete len:321 (-) comp22800_c0_seq1:37-999(-)